MGQLLVVKDDDDIDEEGRHATRLSTPRSAPAPPTRVCRRLCSRACSDLRQHGSMCSAFMVDLDGTICAGRGHRQWCLRTDNGAFDWSPSTFRRSMSRDASAWFPTMSGWYHLYVSYACPWASRWPRLPRPQGPRQGHWLLGNPSHNRMPSHLTARACSDQLISVSVAFDNNGCAKSICFGPSCRLMGKVASNKCHKWVFKEPSECESVWA
jgi:hypothetical protein